MLPSLELLWICRGLKLGWLTLHVHGVVVQVCKVA